MYKFILSIILIYFISATSGRSQTMMIEQRKAQIQFALASPQPVIRLFTRSSAALFNAQETFIKDGRIRPFLFDKESGAPLLNEIFSVSEARPTDIPEELHIPQSGIYRVELYNYALNATLLGLVSTQHDSLVHLVFYENMQPDLPPFLGNLAVEIAIHDSMVIKSFGYQPDPAGVRMQATKTALNRTKCQRSNHLCLAPTFVKDDKALWAIVDLHELKVAGVKWTAVGNTGMAVTERIVQNEEMMSCFCDIENSAEKDTWSFKYSLSRSDGLVLKDIKYKNQTFFRNVKTVDWHVSYSNTEGFGYSDAIGCPEYSSAAVLAIEAPYFEWMLEDMDTLGFSLIQEYFSEGWPTPCSYNYRQKFEFYRDGSFRPVIGSLGRGCGNDATYRPVTRIALAGEKYNIHLFKEGKWIQQQQEFWVHETTSLDFYEDHIVMKAENDEKGFYLEANRGQFDDGGRGDRAYYYVTRYDTGKNEGETDLPTLGPCCNTDFRQGPEKFINRESITDESLVIWYVPELKNDNRKGFEYCWAESVVKDGLFVPKVYPCFSGPKIIPVP